MRQRGRKSSAALLTFPTIDGTRLNPPSSLTKAERSLFIELAAHAPHLTATDVPLLASFAQSIVLCRKLGRDPNRADTWQKLVRAQAMLATKLRLTPQSHRERAAGRRQQPQGDNPW